MTLDESNIFQKTLAIARNIESCYFNYDGFVIVQTWEDSDMLSSCLSFMIQGLTKPIIFTGGVAPMEQMNNDLIPNLIESCFISGAYEIPEVMIYCSKQLFRANRTFLNQPDSVYSFSSPNYPVLAEKETTLKINWEAVLKKPIGSLDMIILNEDFNDGIRHCYVVPDLSTQQVDNVFDEDDSTQAILVEAFGTGNLPSESSYFVQSLKKALARGVPVFFTSQCHKGGVESLYESSAVAHGTISCEDLTVPAAYAKIAFLTKKVASRTLNNHC